MLLTDEEGNVLARIDEPVGLRMTQEELKARRDHQGETYTTAKAMADLNRAIELNPREALAWRIRGATSAGKAEYQKALADYTESLRIDPENPESLLHRAVMNSVCTDARYRDGNQAVQDATKACELTEWKDWLLGGDGHPQRSTSRAPQR